MSTAENDIAESLISTCRFLARAYLANGNPALARDLVERMRIAADELTADINAYASARKKS